MINIKANKREKSSSGFTNKLRSDGFIPAILYGGKSENEKISIVYNKLLKISFFLCLYTD